MPLLFIITFFCHFQDVQHFLIITHCKKFLDSKNFALNNPTLQFLNRVHAKITKFIFYVDFM